MIRIQRPTAETPALATERAERLLEVARLPGAAGPLQTRYEPGKRGLNVHQPQKLIPTDTIDGYQVARSDLYTAQGGKCCYCERTPEEKWQDTEHFRPKAAYWWLAWTWENLLFSCKNCNTPKETYFPLHTAKCRQPPPATGLTERPLFLDPADPQDDDPLQHIRFQHEEGFRWRPIPRDGSRRGAEMIRACELDRPNLMDQYRKAAIAFEDTTLILKAAIESRDAARITREWERICVRRLSAHMPFVALHHDMLDHWFPPVIRSRYNLTLAVIYPP